MDAISHARSHPTRRARPPIRIGELSRRVGVSPGTLRAWERRYGILSPHRTESGYRLYTAEDEARIRELTRLQDEGVATAEAARLAREDPHLAVETGHGTVTAGHAAPSQAGARVAGRAASSEEDAGAQAPASLRLPVADERLERLIRAVEAFDEHAAHDEMDRAIAELSLAALVEDLVLPLLRRLGERWQVEGATPAQEHFASNFVRGRLMALGRGWGATAGPVALLACPSGERHDMGLLAFGLLLRERGWRIAFLGQDTPALTVAETAEILQPDAVVIGGVDPRKLRAQASELEGIASEFALYVGGAAASKRLAEQIGAILLEGEPSYGADVLSAAPAPA